MASPSRIDPVCGMLGTLEHDGQWFCSPSCVAEYDARRQGQGRRWQRSRAVWGLGLLAAGLLIGHVWAPARPVSDTLWGYLAQAGWAVAVGLLLGGLVDHYLPKEYITAWLTGHRRRTIMTAAGLGFLASACSHGCLALSMALYRKGASVPAVMTFLLASPWASLPLTLLLISLLGWAGLLIVVCALVVAVITGRIFQSLERRGALDSNPHTVAVAPEFSLRQDLVARLRRRRWDRATVAADLAGIGRGIWALADMVLWWVAVGFVVGAVLGVVIPHGWWSRWMGATPLGLLVTMAVATVIEVCSEGTAPLAVTLYRQTGALGNTFAFLMGGVVTDYTELALVWANLGRRAVFWLLVVTLPQVFVIGWLLNSWR